jgi:ERCC4-type nuclease
MDKDTLDSSDELKYWLTLTFIKDIGPITVKKLLSVFRTPRNLLEAPLKELQKVEDAKITRARAIYAFHSWDLVDLELSKKDRETQHRGDHLCRQILS